MTPHASELSRLASMAPGPRRDRLTLVLADTLADRRLRRRDVAEVIGEVLTTLVVAASRELRIAVAAKVADVDWAPRELALSLALDDFEVAEPVVARFRAFLEEDLITIAERGSTPHRVALAGRTDVTEAVSDALAAASEPEALAALLENHDARLSRVALKTCVEAARANDRLHGPLAARPDLPPEFVDAVYLVVSEELRAEIAARYDVDEQSLRRVIGAAVKQVTSGDAQANVIDAENAALVRALRHSGSLTSEFITRAVLCGQVGILEHAVANLTTIALPHVRAAIDGHEGWAVALCCRVCDIPRRDFPSIVEALVQSGRIPPVMTSSIERAAAQAFVSHSPASATDALRRIARAD